ncbi:MAG: hypothetical protein ABI551_00235 [Polyangiaceae bacterium]
MTDRLHDAGAMAPGALESLVDAWCAHDEKHAFLPGDGAIITDTRTLRALVCDEAMRGATRDFFHACSRLGTMIGASGGSPTLLEATAAGLVEAIAGEAKVDPLEVGVALAEGFAAARADLARDERLASWEPPHCLVVLDESTVAIAAGFPDDDAEALSSWSGKVAQAVLAAGARHARVSGRPAAVTAAVDALTLVGVTVAASREGGEKTEKTSWLPWRRKSVK